MEVKQKLFVEDIMSGDPVAVGPEDSVVFVARLLFEKNFKIRANIYDKKKKGFALFFGVVETKKLHSLLDPYTLPSMQYKLSTLP